MTAKKESKLIFFDTFSHSLPIDGNSLDLVQFTSPVIIHEVRVIPLGTRVQAKFTNGDRLGATNPSSFDLQFFVNDLSHPSSSKFIDIGSLSYQQNVNICMTPNKLIPTDGLLFQGSYQILTLAVLGEVTDMSSIESVKRATEVNSPLLLKDNLIDGSGNTPSVSLSCMKHESMYGMEVSENTAPEVLDESSQGGLSELSSIIGNEGGGRCLSLDDLSSPSRSMREFESSTPGDNNNASRMRSLSKSPISSSMSHLESCSFTMNEETNNSEKRDSFSDVPVLPPVDPDLLENISPDASPIGIDDDQEFENSVQKRITESKRKELDLDADSISDVDFEDDEPFVDTKSQEEDLEEISDDDIPVDDGDDNDTTFGDVSTMMVNTVDVKVPDHIVFFDPRSSSLVCLDSTHDPCQYKPPEQMESLSDMLASLEDYLDGEYKTFHSTFAGCLATNYSSDEVSMKNMVDRLVTLLDYVEVNPEKKVLSISHLKNLLNIFQMLFQGPNELRGVCLRSKVILKLTTSFALPDMTPPVKLWILQVLDRVMDFSEGMRYCLFTSYTGNELAPKTVYQWILEMMLTNASRKVMNGLKTLLEKCHFYEGMFILKKLSSSSEASTEAAGIVEQLTFMISNNSCLEFLRLSEDVIPVSVIFKRKQKSPEQVRQILRTLFVFLDENEVLSLLENLLEMSDNGKQIVLSFLDHLIQVPTGMLFLSTNDKRVDKVQCILRKLLNFDDSTRQAAHIYHCLHIAQVTFDISWSHQNLESLVHQLYMTLFSDDGCEVLDTVFNDDYMFSFLMEIADKRCSSKLIMTCISQVIDQVALTRRQIMGLSTLILNEEAHKILRSCPTLGVIQHVLSKITKYDRWSSAFLDKTIQVIQDFTSISDPMTLLTILRVIVELAIPSKTLLSQKRNELKYDHFLCEYFGHGLYDVLTKTLADLLKSYSRNYIQPLTSSEKIIRLETLTSLICILKEIIKQLVFKGDHVFRDHSIVKLLVRAHCVVYRIDTDSLYLNKKRTQFQELVHETLLLFTRIDDSFKSKTLIQIKDNIDAKTNQWIIMLKELLSSNPLHAAASLSLLNLMLPHKLRLLENPCEKDKQILDGLVRMRDYWSLHLELVIEEIEAVILNLACSSSTTIVQQLKQFFLKLIHLSIPCVTACCSSLMSSFTKLSRQIEKNNWFSNCNEFMKDPSFHATMIYTLFQGKKEEETTAFLSSLSKVETRMMVVSFLAEILPKEDHASVDFQQLSNTIPSADHLNRVFHVLVSLLRENLEEEVALGILKIFGSFCSQDYKRFMLKRFFATPSERDVLISNLESVTSEVVLKAFFDFLDVLTQKNNSDLLEDILDHAKKVIINGREVTHSVWSTIISRIKTCCESCHADIDVRAVLPKPQELQVIMQGIQSNEITSEPNPSNAVQLESVSVNLSKLATDFLGNDFSLTKELKTTAGIVSQASVTQPKTVISLRRKEDQIPSQQQPRNFNNKRIFVTNSPSTGKRVVLTRGGSSLHHQHQRHSGNNAGRVDTFRSRPPNTSRPPSMHVDDFVAREQQSCSSVVKTRGGTPALRGKQRSSPLLGKGSYHSSSPKRFKS